MSRKREKNKKVEKMELIISASIAIFIILLVVVLVIISKLVADKKSSSGESTQKEDDYSRYAEEAAKYSAGLDENGKISGIANINDYVTLPADVFDYELYLKDYPIEEDLEKASAGNYLIEKIAENSAIKEYEPYRKAMEDICRYNAEGWYTAYVEAHKNVEESEKYTTFEDFLKYAQNMDMETYENHIKEASLSEMKKYMVEQALIEKYNITYTDEDITETAILFDVKATNEKNAKETIARFGLPYMKQRTAEHKLEIMLVEKAPKKEGSIKDGWKDNSLIYSAGLYDNGRISGIGDISIYVNELYDVSKLDESSKKDVDSLLEVIYDNSKIKEYPEYTEKIKSIYALETGTKPSENEGKSIAECKYRILIQYLFDKYELSTELVKTEFFENMSSDERAEYEYTHGNAYVNRQLMEFAVKKHLSK